MTKKQMSDRIAELEAMVLTLSAAINAMRTPIYVAPAQPFVVPTPTPAPPYMPYIGDPPAWPGSGWTSIPNIGGIGGTWKSGSLCGVQNTMEG